MEELIAAYEESYELPENALLLTFDDGYIDHFTNVYPVLADAGVQGSFYIPDKVYAEHKLLDV
ncbi:polysaccharide deacetylase family protein [Clostridium sp.]